MFVQFLRGRDADTGVQEHGGDDGGGVPAGAGDAGVREPVGRGGVGDAGTDWSRAPFTASYRGLAASGCTSQDATACANPGSPWMYQQQLDSASQDRLRQVQRDYMIYNYCADTYRFPQGLPPECTAK